MPSPTRETRIEIDASDCLQPLPSNDGLAYVPSIPAGHTVTLPGSIKVLIREPNMPIQSSRAYKVATVIALKATMPGLNRRLDNFDVQKSCEIQYPLELQQIDYLRSVAQGSENKISMQIYNRANKVFGVDRVSPRRAEVKLSIPPEAGSLLTALGTWSSEVFQNAGKVAARSTFEMSQTSKISHGAKDHAYTTVQVQFFISSPGPAPAIGRSLGELGIPMRLTQSFDLKIQISAAHVFDEEAGILIVTNVKTPPERFEAIGDFIRNDLCLKMDVWNVSQYGGLTQQEQNEEDDETTRNILEEYRGRTIIFLGNQFEHFGVQEQTMINLCESQIVGKECFAGSSCLLLGSAAKRDKRDEWLKHSVFPVSHRISDFPTQVAESATFETKSALRQSISEQRMSGMSTLQAYQIKSQPKWYYGGAKMSVKIHAKQTRKYLRSNLPQERFWVCPVYPRIDGGQIHPGYVAIWHGLPSNRNVFATESKNLLEERGKVRKLHSFDSFNIICSLSYALRIHLLCSFDGESATAVGEKEDGHASVISQDSAKYSDEILNAVQFSLEEEVSHEIQNYLGHSPTFNKIALGKSQAPGNQFEVHFPCLETVLQGFEGLDGTSPRVLEILRMSITATNPQTVGQVARSLTLPIGQRRAQLKSYLIRRIESVLTHKGYSPALLEEFRITTQDKHSRFSSTKRDTWKLIEERNRQFVKVPMNEYRKGRVTTEDLVEGTELCTENEWDARCREVEKTRVELKRSVTRVMTKRGKMSTLKLERVGEM